MIKDFIKRIDSTKNYERRKGLKKILDELQIPYKIQFFHLFLYTGENIIIDYPFEGSYVNDRKILLTTHYDTFFNSPGANDNASGVAVLLNFVNQLKREKIDRMLRFIFFDAEERYRIVGSDVNGSSAYVKKFGLEDIECVYNLEMVGRGENILIWPVKESLRNREFVNKLTINIEKCKTKFFFMEKTIPFFNSDHLPFIRRGFSKAVSITTINTQDKKFIKLFNDNRWKKLLLEYFKYFLTERGNIPEILKSYHNKKDNLSAIQEKTLRLTFDILWQTVKSFS